ncbi:peptide synthetase [Spongiactinospora gelatinilytica]|uniref:Peptide synthetase n=1 Tax=Spongiactinospora gelatinilytica TaxID=2666298 RepID=A0A2W2GLS4_9ACTN|nr:AMP-binding protein [Spongiactinospora gelatinilytica]PZG48853.1 peptide synthetase [Spongiactinospora gelatinilytica]
MTEARFIHSLLDEAAAAAPASTAVRDASGAWSYARLRELSHAAAAWLQAHGVRPGDRVLVQLPSEREAVALLYGTSRAGAVHVPINPAMKAFHLGPVIENAEPRLIIAADTRTEELSRLGDVPVHPIGQVWAEVEALAGQAARAGSPPDLDPGAIAVLIYTSGSTAAPKAVVCPHAQVLFATEAITSELGYRADDVVFCRFPLSWDYGLYKVLMTCASRSQIVLADGESDLLLLKLMRECGATVVPIVPSLAAMIITLLGREEEPPPPVRLFTNTGAALPPSTIDALRAAFPGVRVVRQFGQTECKRISIMPPEEDRERPRAVGRPLPGTRVLILDDAGAPVPTGEVGEIVATGPHVMPGYWRNPEMTARSFRADPVTGEPRLHTGDYGWLDDDGYLYFEGRRDDMFKRKGIRMSTVEIEAAAMDLPGVRAAAALPPAGDHDLALCVETDLAPHAVLRELARRLEPAKVPATCHTFDQLPLSLHGKNARTELAALIHGGAR